MVQKKEVIDLYTADRIPTGQTILRGDKPPAGMYRLVVHVCIFNSKGEMLIQKRKDDIVRWPGYWDVSVGGHASSGDTSSSAAQRETKEELGLSIEFDEVRPVLTVQFPDGFDDFYVLQIDVDPEGLNLQKEEVAAVQWASQAEIDAMIDDGSFIPYQKGLIDYLFFSRSGKSTWNIG
ncbi:MAG: NUDIX domain-containing protein [Firmicutes bacterium]|nr:NUDIX domain-containing protein [Bacillota bacterium]